MKPIALAVLLSAAPLTAAAVEKKTAAVSDEARRHLMRGRAAMKDAKDAAGFVEAAKEFEAAGSPEALYNAGVAYEKAGDPASALKQFKAYLEAAPKAKDAQTVKDRIYELEYRAEKAADLSGCWQSASFFTGDYNNDSDMEYLYGRDWCEFVIEKGKDGAYTARPFKTEHVLRGRGSAPPTNLSYSLKDVAFSGRKTKLTLIEIAPHGRTVTEYDLELTPDGQLLTGPLHSVTTGLFKNDGRGTAKLFRVKSDKK